MRWDAGRSSAPPTRRRRARGTARDQRGAGGRAGRRDGGSAADRAPGAAAGGRLGDAARLRRAAPLRRGRRHGRERRGVRGLGLRPAPRHRRREPQPAAGLDVRGGRARPARARSGATSSGATTRASGARPIRPIMSSWSRRSLRGSSASRRGHGAHLARVEANLLARERREEPELRLTRSDVGPREPAARSRDLRGRHRRGRRSTRSSAAGRCSPFRSCWPRLLPGGRKRLQHRRSGARVRRPARSAIGVS